MDHSRSCNPSTDHDRTILRWALAVFLADQATKGLVTHFLAYGTERSWLPGFFNLVHWGNTGSAWSMFRDNNTPLAAVSALALLILWAFRDRFEPHLGIGRSALGLLFGGIAGNLLDRILPSRRHVVDFLYFHLHPKDGGELGFPAFNIADSAICIGVGLLILRSWQSTASPPDQPQPQPKTE